MDHHLEREAHLSLMNLIGRRCGPVTLMIALLAIGARADAQTMGKLDPILQQRLNQFLGRSKIVVTASDAVSQAIVAQIIQLAGGTLGRRLPIINGQAATIPNAGLAQLAVNPAVQHVAADRLILGADDLTNATVGASAVQQMLGLDGSGVGVAVVDSGITAWHDDLADSTLGSQRIDRFVDFVNHAAEPYDDYGHATHVAGIIAGNGFDSGGARSGIAPGAHLIALKVLDASGRGRISNVIAALDDVQAHGAELNIRVVNLSVGAGGVESYNWDPLTQAAKRLVDQGIVVVAAAGNAGRTARAQTKYGGTTAPGNAPWVLTVGASSHMGTADRSDDTIAAFSSRGPTAADRIAKPDVVAPGVGTESLSVLNSTLYNSMSAYLLSGTVLTPSFPYLSLSGTSQATPVVAGTVALMLQANPTLTPNAVKAILQYTAQVYPNYDALTQGSGFLNTWGAVQLASFLGSSSPVPYPSTDGWSQQLIWGNYRLSGGQLTATANAWLDGVLWGEAKTPSGQDVVWGTICTANCTSDLATWAAWQTSCGDPTCTTTNWGNGPPDNVVWGSLCGGANCPVGVPWVAPGTSPVSPNPINPMPAATSVDDTIVWGTTSDDTIVWGTSSDDTIVWGTSSCTDPSCEPVVWSTPQ